MKNIFNKITVQSLKKNKTRTAVTIIGIILSAAMISAVTTFAASIYDYILRVAIYNDGSWHANVCNTDFETFENTQKSEKVEKAVYLQQLGYAKIENSANEYKPYIYLNGASAGVEDMLPIHITSGKYPSADNEILLPEHLASNGGVQYSIGDVLTLELGDRMSGGYKINQSNPVYTYNKNGNTVMLDETLKVKEKRSYKVVGFYERLSLELEGYTAPGYTAFTVADKDISDAYAVDVYFKMNDVKKVYAFMDDNGYAGDYNNDVLIYQGSIAINGLSTMLTMMSAIVIALIVFGSVSLIYNAFSISVSERTKQFGLLSSLGATKKQLKRTVLFEAFAVSVIGIPIGVIAGVMGIGVTLLIIGNKFSSLFGYSKVNLHLCVSWVAIALAAVLALATVLISAWIPSKRATKISAVEAIRQSKDIKLETKPLKSSKLIYKLFGLPGMLASKHYKRNRRKYRTTVISLFMSIVLFVSASSFTDYLMETVGGGLTTSGYDLSYSISSDTLNGKSPKELLKLFKTEKTVSDAIYINDYYASGIIKHKYLNKTALDTLSDAKDISNGTSNPIGYENVIDEYSCISSYVLFIPDSEYRELLKKHNLSEKEFFDPENPLGITLNGKNTFDSDKQKYTSSSVLNSDKTEIICTEMNSNFYSEYSYNGQHTDKNGNVIVELTRDSGDDTIFEFPYEKVFTTYTLKTGKNISEVPYYVDVGASSELRIFYPESFYENVIPETLRSDNIYYNYYIITEDYKTAVENLKTILEDNGFATSALYNYAENAEENRNIVTIIRVFAYGFIILISLIATANVFNTISTNIALRRREFAMLKSVGMTKSGFNKMMNYECLLYGGKAVLYGLPASCAVTYLIYSAVMSGYETAFRLPWIAMAVAILSVFSVVFVTMLYSMSKIKKDNPIEALKNENI